MERHEGRLCPESEVGLFGLCIMCLLWVSFFPQMKMIIALVVVALLLIIISEYQTKHTSTGSVYIVHWTFHLMHFLFFLSFSSSDPAISLMSDEDISYILSCLSSAHSPPLQLRGASQLPTPSSVSACDSSRIWPQLALSTNLTVGISTKVFCEVSTKAGFDPWLKSKLQIVQGEIF